MKRIAIYINSEFNGSGGSQYTKSVLNALITLSSDNFVLTVIYTCKCWEDFLKRVPNVTLIFFKKTDILNRLYQFLILSGNIFITKQIAHKFDKKVKYIEDQNFDFIIFPSVDTIACLINSKTIGTIHDLMHRYEKSFKEAGSFFIYNYRENYFKNLLLSSTAILVDSNLGSKQVFDSYKQIKSKVFILPFIAPDYIYAIEENNPPQSNLYYSNHRYLFYPAVFWSHKNHLQLLKAIKLLKEKGQQIDLLLAGKKQLEYKKLLKFVMENDLEENVKFLGYVSDVDMVNIYKNAYAMIMPTFFGPTNIPPIEAILLNCPPIVSSNYAMQEQFEDAAIYFNPNSSFEIADAIESLLENNMLRNNLLLNGKKIKEKFSQKRFESDLRNILQNLNILLP